MPFSKYIVGPARIEAAREAFRRICEALQLNCGTEDPMTEIVVEIILKLAKAGESDPARMCAAVLAELETTRSPARMSATSGHVEGLTAE
jgi:hypothetical protein